MCSCERLCGFCKPGSIRKRGARTRMPAQAQSLRLDRPRRPRRNMRLVAWLRPHAPGPPPPTRPKPAPSPASPCLGGHGCLSSLPTRPPQQGHCPLTLALVAAGARTRHPLRPFRRPPPAPSSGACAIRLPARRLTLAWTLGRCRGSPLPPCCTSSLSVPYLPASRVPASRCVARQPAAVGRTS